MEGVTRKPSIKRRNTSDSKVERKRELDRIAQRATRERTKNRIAFLEQKLASLESNNQSTEIISLTRIIEGLRNDNARLQAAMMKMKMTINDTLDGILEAENITPQAHVIAKSCGCSANAICSCDLSASPRRESTMSDSGSLRHGSLNTEESETIIDIPEPAIDLDPKTMPADTPNFPTVSTDMATAMNGLEALFGVTPMPNMNYELTPWEYASWQQASPSPFDFRMPLAGSTLSLARDIDKWSVSNGAFISCMDSVKKKMATNQTLDLHVPFRAVMWGWDSIGPEVMHPVWQALRRVDQQVFGTWTSKAQRVALMYVCQTLLQYRENPTKENLLRVPTWFRPRPAQEKIQHPAVIDFLIWPGLRDRLVFEHQKYTATGDMSAAFVNNFNFYWPYSDSQILSYNQAMDTYEVSKVFLQYAYDFKNWTMRRPFFEAYPEMKHDIPEFGSDEFNTHIWTT